MNTSSPNDPAYLAVLDTLPKGDVVRMAISAGRLLEHPGAISDALEVELRAFIDQLDEMGW